MASTMRAIAARNGVATNGYQVQTAKNSRAVRVANKGAVSATRGTNEAILLPLFRNTLLSNLLINV